MKIWEGEKDHPHPGTRMAGDVLRATRSTAGTDGKQESRNRGSSSNKQHRLLNISKKQLLHSSPWQWLLVWSPAAEITSFGTKFCYRGPDC